MRTRRKLLLQSIGCAAIALCLGAATEAIERKPLPAFTLTTLGGATTQSADLTQDGRWLFIYVRPACDQCAALLNTIDEADQPLVAARMVIVIGGLDVAGAAQFAAAFPKLTTAAWYADPSRSVPRLVKAPGIPFVFGMKQRITEWGWIGLLPDAASATSALVSWAGR